MSKDEPGEGRSIDISIVRDKTIREMGGARAFADARKADACCLCGKSPLGPFDDELTWGELRAQRPDITDGECAAILWAGFDYEHEDGTTVEMTNEQRLEINQEERWAEARREALLDRQRAKAARDLGIREWPCGCCRMPAGSGWIWFACEEHGGKSGAEMAHAMDEG